MTFWPRMGRIARSPHVEGHRATFVPPVGVCITYDPLQSGDPNSLRPLHFENDAWVDVTTSNDTTNHVICGQVTSFSVFAIARRSGAPLTSLGPANIWVGLKNSDDVGIRFDLRAEVYRNGTQLVGSGEVASVPGGSSGFNNAKEDTITLTRVEGATFQSGDAVSIKLYVRNACTGSSKNSGGPDPRRRSTWPRGQSAARTRRSGPGARRSHELALSQPVVRDSGRVRRGAEKPKEPGSDLSPPV